MIPSGQAFQSNAAPPTVGTATKEGTMTVNPGDFRTEGPASGDPQVVDAPEPAGAMSGSSGPGGTRRVRLTVSRIDPWSVLKLSFLLSVALGIGLVTATIVLWIMINIMGVFDGLNDILQNTDSEGGTSFDVYNYVGLGRVISLSTFISVLNVIIIMALSTLGAFLYNTAASLVGGLHITLSDD
jgi:hypothetical protein